MIKKLHSFFFRWNPYIFVGLVLTSLGYVTVSKEFLVIPVILMALGALNFGIGVEYGYWIEQILDGKEELKSFY